MVQWRFVQYVSSQAANPFIIKLEAWDCFPIHVILSPLKSVSVETALPGDRKRRKLTVSSDKHRAWNKSFLRRPSGSTRGSSAGVHPTRVYVFPLQCIAPHHSNFHLSENKILPRTVPFIFTTENCPRKFGNTNYYVYDDDCVSQTKIFALMQLLLSRFFMLLSLSRLLV